MNNMVDCVEIKCLRSYNSFVGNRILNSMSYKLRFQFHHQRKEHKIASGDWDFVDFVEIHNFDVVIEKDFVAIFSAQSHSNGSTQSLVSDIFVHRCRSLLMKSIFQWMKV